jgi:hypothetical protein
MSLLPILWALKSAPVADAEERLILVTLAERAWADDSDALPSKKTIAKVAMIDPKTVQRRLRAMEKRGLIALGDQSAAAHIPEHFRPTVYDLMIPYSWFPDIDQANEERTRRGKPPLTPADRPDLADAPPRKQRADKGKRRTPAPRSDGGSTSPRGEDSQSPGQTGQEGGSTSPGGGVYKSQRGGLQDPQPSPTNPPRNTPRPSVPDDSATAGDGGTDGSRVPSRISRNPGVDLLLAIGAEKPEFLLTGKPLQDQGLVVAGMLLEGWTPEQLRQVIAGRSLPDEITTTVGSIVSSRLRQALAGPVPETVGNGTYMTSAVSGGVATLPRQTVAPLRNCDRCDHAFRSPEPGLCRPCREDASA